MPTSSTLESEANLGKDPLVFWLNAGPGYSSFDGFVYEHSKKKKKLCRPRNLGLPYLCEYFLELAKFMFIFAQRTLTMDDNDSNDFTFCKVDSQAVNEHIESPKAIPDVNRITKDQFSDDKDLKKSYDSFRDNNSSANFPKKFVASSGFPLFGSSGIPQPDFSSNGSLVLEIGRSNGESVSGIDGPKPVLRKQPVRAKVPFEKGYSQMDWLKLTRTHPDLAGLKGETNRRLITMDEVKKHKTEGSIWTVLKGRVYNLSPYMKFHPGGVDMLMMAAGKDCTSLFNKHHPWVNSEFLLEKCLVGLLDADT